MLNLQQSVFPVGTEECHYRQIEDVADSRGSGIKIHRHGLAQGSKQLSLPAM